MSASRLIPQKKCQANSPSEVKNLKINLSTSNFAFLFVVSLLFGRQWLITMRFFYDSIKNAIITAFSFLIRTIISLIRKYRLFVSTNKVFKLFGVMDIGRSISNFAYNTRAFIYSYMAFIPIIGLFTFLSKTGIIILLWTLLLFFFRGAVFMFPLFFFFGFLAE